MWKQFFFYHFCPFSIGIILLFAVKECESVTPRAVIELFDEDALREMNPSHSIFASTATFGPKLHFGKPRYSEEAFQFLPIKVAPSNLCKKPDTELISSSSALYSNTIMLVPRGSCSYQEKTSNAEMLGAKHVIIYDVLSSRYTNTNKWPYEDVDYDCSNGQAMIPEEQLGFFTFLEDTNTKRYDESMDHLFTGSTDEGNLCAIYHNVGGSKEKFEDICSSKRCLLTGKMTFSNDNRREVVREACCSWDIYMQMEGDRMADDVSISTTFLTMEEGDNLLHLLEKDKDGVIRGVVYERWHPKFNAADFLVCLLASLVVWISSWMSAEVYRDVRDKLENTELNLGNSDDPPLRNVATIENNEPDEENDSVSEPQNSADLTEHQNDSSAEEAMAPRGRIEDVSSDGHPAPLETENQNRADRERRNEDPETVPPIRPRMFWYQDLVSGRLRTTGNAMAAAFILLFFLFFTRMFDIITIFYVGLGCASILRLLVYPILNAASERIGALKAMKKPICPRSTGPHGYQYLDILGFLIGAAIGVPWILISFRRGDVYLSPFYWIVQDIMSVCICIFFLGSMRLHQARVPIFVLVMALAYDMFFNFLTPLVFDYRLKFVGEDGLGTGGDKMKDPYICEKDTKLRACNYTPSPIQLVIPVISDYRGGMSMISIINVLLPGLLCCFVARYDAAKYVVRGLSLRRRAARRNMSNVSLLLPQKKSILHRIFSGYFSRLIMIYSVGLLLARISCALIERIQSDLMYAAPLMLLFVFLRSRQRDEFGSLWIGPKRLLVSDHIAATVILEGAEMVGAGVLDDDLNTIDTRSIISSDSEMGNSHVNQ